MNVNALSALMNFTKKPISVLSQAKAPKVNYKMNNALNFRGNGKGQTLYGANYPDMLSKVDTKRKRTIPKLQEAKKRGEDIQEDRDKLILSRIPKALEDAENFVEENPQLNVCVDDISQDLIKIIIDKTDHELAGNNKGSIFGPLYLKSKDLYLNRVLKKESNSENVLHETEPTEDPFEIVDEKEFNEVMEKVLKRLTLKEEKIIRELYGLDGEDPKTRVEIGKEYNISKESVRQIEARALRKLRHPICCKQLKDFV